MKVLSAEFVLSAKEPAHYPPAGLPEIAFAGRSNVGKSSLINTLLNRKGLARTSNTPGRTQEINFFTVNNRLAFIDLPGYGYAKVPEAIRKQLGADDRDLSQRAGNPPACRSDSRHPARSVAGRPPADRLAAILPSPVSHRPDEDRQGVTQ